MKLFQSIERDTVDWPHTFPILIARTEGVTPSFQRLHWHSALEINYIVQGSGYYLINGGRYDFRQGDIVLINSDELHRAFETEDLVMGVVMFDPAYLALEQRYDTELLAPFRDLGLRFRNVLERGHPKLPKLASLITGMMEEYGGGAPHFEAVVRAQLVQFLAYVNRYFAAKETGGAVRARGMDSIRLALREMERDAAYPWTLRDLAGLAHLSTSRFSALFAAVVGTSPMDYLIQLRLSRAVELIGTTDRLIIDIAAECGFRNLSNFNRLFKCHVGKYPSQLRGER